MRALRIVSPGERLSVLCLGAHSDDIEIGAGATILGWIAAGVALALAAATATMRVYRDDPAIEHLYRQGTRLRAGVEAAVARRGLERHIKLMGRPCCLLYATLDRDAKPSQAFRTLFLQETIKRGILMPSLVVSYSHNDADIDSTIEAIDAALVVYARALEDGPERHLVGRPSQVVYRRFNRPEAALGL